MTTSASFYDATAAAAFDQSLCVAAQARLWAGAHDNADAMDTRAEAHE